MTKKTHFSVENGLATFDSEMVQIRNLLENQFLTWAAECNAEVMLYPPLMPVEDLEKLDYFRNFPHLALIASAIQPERLAQEYTKGGVINIIPNTHLTSSKYVLPSAACYNIYLSLRNTILDAPKYITTVATCFRNEKEYKGLQRLWGFNMREIVCIGSLDAVQTHLSSFKQQILSFATDMGLSLELQVATDPFYQPQNSRAVMQKVFPVKQEFVYEGSVAIASVNFHRNFFGERCHIRTADDKPAFSGCVAFGIERWFHALFDHFDGDAEAIKKAITLSQSAVNETGKTLLLQ